MELFCILVLQPQCGSNWSLFFYYFKLIIFFILTFVKLLLNTQASTSLDHLLPPSKLIRLYWPYVILPIWNNQTFTCHLERRNLKVIKKKTGIFKLLYYIARKMLNWLTKLVIKNRRKHMRARTLPFSSKILIICPWEILIVVFNFFF